MPEDERAWPLNHTGSARTTATAGAGIRVRPVVASIREETATHAVLDTDSRVNRATTETRNDLATHFKAPTTRTRGSGVSRLSESNR